MKTIRIPFVAALLLHCSPATSASEWQQDFWRFQLFNNCMPISFLMSEIDADSQQLGISREEIHGEIERRLRSKQIALGEGDSVLYVSFAFNEQTFVIRAEFAKPLYDGHSDNFGYAPTWSSTRIGSPVTKDIFLSHVFDLADKFVSSYGQVNSGACESE